MPRRFTQRVSYKIKYVKENSESRLKNAREPKIVWKPSILFGHITLGSFGSGWFGGDSTFYSW